MAKPNKNTKAKTQKAPVAPPEQPAEAAPETVDKPAKASRAIRSW